MVKKKQFLELLSASFNISTEAEPFYDDGIDLTAAALKFTDDLYDRIESAKDGEVDGMIIVMRLFIEILSSDNPDEYIKKEIQKGF